MIRTCSNANPAGGTGTNPAEGTGTTSYRKLYSAGWPLKAKSAETACVNLSVLAPCIKTTSTPLASRLGTFSECCTRARIFVRGQAATIDSTFARTSASSLSISKSASDGQCSLTYPSAEERSWLELTIPISGIVDSKAHNPSRSAARRATTKAIIAVYVLYGTNWVSWLESPGGFRTSTVYKTRRPGTT